MFKDILLIEAALATDQTIISLDETVRQLFANLAPEIRDLRTIVWANPELEDLRTWLAEGASPERARMLGEHHWRAGDSALSPTEHGATRYQAIYLAERIRA